MSQQPRKEIRIQNVPKHLHGDLEEITDYFGVPVCQLILSDIIIAIKKLRKKIPQEKIVQPQNENVMRLPQRQVNKKPQQGKKKIKKKTVQQQQMEQKVNLLMVQGYQFFEKHVTRQGVRMTVGYFWKKGDEQSETKSSLYELTKDMPTWVIPTTEAEAAPQEPTMAKWDPLDSIDAE